MLLCKAVQQVEHHCIFGKFSYFMYKQIFFLVEQAVIFFLNVCDMHTFFKYLIDVYILLFSLEDVLLQDGKLYLVFEFLSMDLKKYMDTLPSNQFMEKQLVKVCIMHSN